MWCHNIINTFITISRTLLFAKSLYCLLHLTLSLQSILTWLVQERQFVWCCVQVHLSSASQLHDWVFLLLSELQLKLRTQILFNGLSRFWADYYILIYTHFQELMKSVGSHGSLSLLLVMEVRSDSLWVSHKVMTALIVLLPSNWRCGDFSAIS
jgi:hypothetical protein